MMNIEREILKKVLWSAIEDDVKLLHLLPDIYSEINHLYDIDLTIAKNILLFCLNYEYVSLFFENWKDTKRHIEIPKNKALELLLKTSSWEELNDSDLWIVVRATKKGEALYFSDDIMSERFEIPKIIPS